MTRVAVQLGRARVRVATEERLLADLPTGGVDPPTMLAGLLDLPVDELVVVHPVGARRAAGAGDVAAALAAALACPVRAVPAPVAALAAHTVAALARPPGADGAHTGPPDMDGAHAGPWDADGAHTGPPDAVVVDVGHAGAEVAYLHAGRVVAVRDVAVGGARLDGVTAQVLARAGAAAGPDEARRVREALSLLPRVRAGTPPVTVSAAELRAALAPLLGEVVDAVRSLVAAVGPGRAPPVLLIGGVARTPLLAELLDEVGGAGALGGARPGGTRVDEVHLGEVHVVDRPDTAAVTGALRVAGPVAPDAGRGLAARRVAVPSPRAAPEHVWLPPLRGPRRSRAVAGVLAAVAAALGLLVAGAALPPGPGPGGTSTSTAPRASQPGSSGELVQYGYAARLPPGWAHTGGLPERRRSLLTPTATPDGSDLISVERTPLGYDTGAEPERARRELRAEFAAAVAAGAPLSGFADDARYAGRPVVSYREADDATGTDVAWYVVLDGDAQLSVGCRATPAGTDAVGAACATVVGSLRLAR